MEDPRVARSKEAITAATLELLVERGVSGATIEAIAERSGVAKTTIYRHWPEKADLVVDVFASQLREPVDPDTGTFEGDLAVMAAGLAKGMASGPWSSLLPSLVEEAEHDERLATLLGEITKARHRTIEGVIDRARRRGEIGEGLTDDDLVDLVAGPIFYRRWMRRATVSPKRARRLASVVAEAAAPAGGASAHG